MSTDSDKTPILLHPAKRVELMARGQELFNDENFFEAHEAWEELWKVEQGRDRIFVQGLILAAAHFVHLKKGNWSGARQSASSARQKLSGPSSHKLYRELDIEALFAALDYNAGLCVEIKPDRPPPVPEAFLIPKLLAR